jgi:hypothetical protein
MGAPYKGNTPGSVRRELCSVMSSLNMYPEPIDGSGEYLSNKDHNAAHAVEHALQALRNINAYESCVDKLLRDVMRLCMSKDNDELTCLHIIQKIQYFKEI